MPARTSNFGGVKVNFKGVQATGEQIFGSDAITYGAMTSKIHKFINENGLKVGGKAESKIETEEEED